MKNRTVSAFALASVLALASTPGHALSFDFSFSNVTGNIAGTVTGLIEGLTDNTTSAATHVIVETYPAGLTLPAAPFETNVPDNSFTVSNGSITQAGFVGVAGRGSCVLVLGRHRPLVLLLVTHFSAMECSMSSVVR